MDETTLCIRSISSNRELIFSSCDESDRYRVEIKSDEITASIEIFQYEVGASLASFFRHLASFRTPWQDPQVWHTYDPDLRISATCTKRGHVLFRIIFVTGYVTGQGAESWEANVGLETTLGELDNIARKASSLFQGTISET
jgi:hypothetical protein